MKTFLQDINQRIFAWLSDADIGAGQRWAVELATQLETTDYGIICITQESLHSPWVLFEAGALGKSVKGVPVLDRCKQARFDGPLAQFQAKEAAQKPTWEMLQSINLAMGPEALAEPRLAKYFETFWPALSSEIQRANRDFHALPEDLTQDLLRLLPTVFYQAGEISLLVREAGLPVWEINLNQAPIYVWREVMEVAVKAQRVDVLLNRAMEFAPGAESQLRYLRERVADWTRFLQEDRGTQEDVG